MTTFQLSQNTKYALIEFTLQEATISPDQLPKLKPPDPIKQNFAHKGVILSGRGPIWLYGYLIHHYHPTKMIAIFDPRLQGAVVISTHHADYKEGQIIKQLDWKTE